MKIEIGNNIVAIVILAFVFSLVVITGNLWLLFLLFLLIACSDR